MKRQCPHDDALTPEDCVACEEAQQIEEEASTYRRELFELFLRAWREDRSPEALRRAQEAWSAFDDWFWNNRPT